MGMGKHTHAHGHQKADGWTNLAAAGEAITSFAADSYWMATLFDIIAANEADALGMSYVGMGIGFGLACLSSLGAAYCHRALNHTHQQPTTDPELATLTPRPATAIDDHEKHLTLAQKAALVGDFISHTTDIASPLTFVISLAGGNAFPRWAKGVVYGASSLFGGFCSVAGVRTCKNTLEDHNKTHRHGGITVSS